MRTKAGFGIVIVGAIILIAGIVSLFSGLSSSRVEASVTSDEAAYVMTDAGVLDLVNVEVHVTVQAEKKDATVNVGIGTVQDVQAWSDGLAVFEIKGLKNWDTLNGKMNAVKVEDLPEVAGSDMWFYEKSGKGKVSFDYEVTDPGNTALIARSSDGSPLTVTLSWDTPGVVTRVLPYIVIGLLTIAIGVVLSLIGTREGEDGLKEWIGALRQKREAKKQGSVKAIDISDMDISVPSREELVEQDRDQQRQHTGGVLGAGIIPIADGEFREDTAEVPRREEALVGENRKASDDEA